MSHHFGVIGVIRMMVTAIKSLFRGRGNRPDDPVTGVRVPVRRGPPDRTSAVALDGP